MTGLAENRTTPGGEFDEAKRRWDMRSMGPQDLSHAQPIPLSPPFRTKRNVSVRVIENPLSVILSDARRCVTAFGTTFGLVKIGRCFPDSPCFEMHRFFRK